MSWGLEGAAVSIGEVVERIVGREGSPGKGMSAAGGRQGMSGMGGKACRLWLKCGPGLGRYQGRRRNVERPGQ